MLLRAHYKPKPSALPLPPGRSLKRGYIRQLVPMCVLMLACLLGNVGAAASGPIISEFMACNKASLLDADHDSSDWIEIHNPTLRAVNLEGWYLTDDLRNLKKWAFPKVSLAARSFLVVFASGKDERDAAGSWHTNFALATGGESVALVEPDGRTVASAYVDYPPQVVDIAYGLGGSLTGYLPRPTPGAPNPTTLVQKGPAIRHVTENPAPLVSGQDLIITVQVTQTVAPIRSVTLFGRIGYTSANRGLRMDGIAMLDDGRGADAVAHDGVYTAVISSRYYGRGDLIRWYVKAEDTAGNASRDPLFLFPTKSPEYYGTVVQDPGVVTPLPVVWWFVENVAGSETRTGARGSVYFRGQFYDNVLIHIRGGSTAGVAKKHFKIHFNPGYKFQYRQSGPQVNEINLNSTFSDKAYLRQTLAFEAYDWCGCPGSESFPVRAQRNGQFYGVQILIEEPEEGLLEREGLDPRGALYKMYNTFNVGGSAEKKTRRWEGRQDLDDFCASINNTSGMTRHNNIFDRVNLPLTLNYLAATVLIHQNDHPHKNHYLYRDSNGSGEWCFLPWDHDLTWGRNWVGNQGGSYGDIIYANDDQVPVHQPATACDPTAIKPSHPFIGKQDCREWNSFWNRLTDALLNDSTVREMYLRRLRTVMDEFLQPPATPYAQCFIEKRIDDLVTQMTPDAALDYFKWANPWSWGGQEGYPRDQSFVYAINVLKNDYLAVRRTHLFVTHNVDRVSSYRIAGSYSAAIPNAQPAQPAIKFGAYDDLPVSGNPDEEYIELVNPNSYAVDLSGWQLVGGVEHTLRPGTVLVAGGKLYLSPNVRAFRSRKTSPTGGQGRFVQGNYKGHLSSWSERIYLLDRSGRIVDTLTHPSP